MEDTVLEATRRRHMQRRLSRRLVHLQVVSAALEQQVHAGGGSTSQRRVQQAAPFAIMTSADQNETTTVDVPGYASDDWGDDY